MVGIIPLGGAYNHYYAWTEMAPPKVKNKSFFPYFRNYEHLKTWCVCVAGLATVMMCCCRHKYVSLYRPWMLDFIACYKQLCDYMG
jgi:hypothetical protein